MKSKTLLNLMLLSAMLGLLACSTKPPHTPEQKAAAEKAQAAVNTAFTDGFAKAAKAMADNGSARNVSKAAGDLVAAMPASLKKFLNVEDSPKKKDTPGGPADKDLPGGKTNPTAEPKVPAPAGTDLASLKTMAKATLIKFFPGEEKKINEAFEQLPKMMKNARESLFDPNEARIVNENETVFVLGSSYCGFVTQVHEENQSGFSKEEARQVCEKMLSSFTAQIRVKQTSEGVRIGLELAVRPGDIEGATEVGYFVQQADRLELALDIDAAGKTMPGILFNALSKLGENGQTLEVLTQAIKASGQVSMRLGLAPSACPGNKPLCVVVDLAKPIDVDVNGGPEGYVAVKIGKADAAEPFFAISTDAKDSVEAELNVGTASIATVDKKTSSEIGIGAVTGKLIGRFDGANAALAGENLLIDVFQVIAGKKMPMMALHNATGTPASFNAEYTPKGVTVTSPGLNFKTPVSQFVLNGPATVFMSLENEANGSIFGQDSKPKANATKKNICGEIEMKTGSAKITLGAGDKSMTEELEEGEFIN